MEIEHDSIGVIVSRFQEPELHPGHRFLLDYVLARHDRVLLIFGNAYESTRTNPLTFEMRKDMVVTAYPQSPITFIGSPSLPSSARRRSELLDSLIEKHVPGTRAVLYGSRDSIIFKYVGKFPCHEVPTVYAGSASEIRNTIDVVNSVDFRKGVIWHATHEKPRGVPSTDIAILDELKNRVLLVGKKDEEGMLRFPGAFFDPVVDTSLEDTAARTIRKELPGIQYDSLLIRASRKIDDWRFRHTLKSIVTLFFTATYRDGNLTAGRGVDTVAWTHVSELRERVVASHQPLVDLLIGE